MPPAAAEPISLRLVAYQVGFGDAFLLTFRWRGGEERHVLVDFGTSELPAGAPRAPAHLRRIALDVAARVGRSPFAVVATHRHADHVAGFATGGPRPRGAAEGRTSGEIIRALAPQVVVQPWTEDPALPSDASGPAGRRGVSSRGYRALLGTMATLSRAAVREGETLEAALRSTSYRAAVGRELRALGLNNLSSASALANLAAMGRRGKAVYARAGGPSGLEGFLPGVKVHVLGPPTVEQAAAARPAGGAEGEAFWALRRRLHGYWREQARMLAGADVAGAVRRPRLGERAGRGPFPRAEAYAARALPPDVRRFRRDALLARGEQLLELVRAVDAALDDTSLVLVFEAGPLRLLFPGDARHEGWSHALSGPEAERNRRLLAGVDLLKIGHHGGLDATPRALWSLLEKRGPHRGLRTVASTLPGVHGAEERRTEVPRRTLVAALRAESAYFTTESLRRELCRAVEVDLAGPAPRWSAWRTRDARRAPPGRR